MLDNISVRILDQNRWMEHTSVIEATLESDIYTADSAYRLHIPATMEIKDGARCQVLVNNQIEMNGIVDRVIGGYDRDNGNTLTIEGRDLMGILIDSYCEDFIDIEGWNVRAVAEHILRRVPYINRKEILYENGADKLDASRAFTHIEPGKRICETLQSIALARGLLFYSLPEGTLIFGVPKGRTSNRFALINKNGQNQSRIISAEWTRDISVRYSKIMVLTQTQNDDAGSGNSNVSATVYDETFPFYKPYVETVNEDETAPGPIAKTLLERQRFEGTKLTYKVNGFSQLGRNWTIDELCHVDDEKIGAVGYKGDLLICGRTFTLSKREGAQTSLKLCLPGVAR